MGGQRLATNRIALTILGQVTSCVVGEANDTATFSSHLINALTVDLP
jgi:hypothetical protein